MEILWVLNGLLLGVAGATGFSLFRLLRSQSNRNDTLAATLEQAIKLVNESHNNLVQTMRDLDQKVTETRMKVDSAGLVKPNTLSRFPSK